MGSIIFTPAFVTDYYDALVSNYAHYKVLIDWNNDGDFTDAGEDVTTDVKWTRFSRGMDSERGSAEVGSCEIRLKNDLGTYTPTKHANILLTAIQISTTTGGKSRLFTGFIEDITPHPNLSQQDCYITGLDGLDHLSRCYANQGTGLDTNPQTAIHALLTAVNWPTANRIIDTQTYQLVTIAKMV